MHIVGERLLTYLANGIPLFLCKQLLIQLDRLHLLGHVVEVDCNGRLIMKFDALDADLVKLLYCSLRYYGGGLFSGVLVDFLFQRVDAVPLLDFVTLRQNNLRQAARTANSALDICFWLQTLLLELK